jgi:heptose I phosphotransferase
MTPGELEYRIATALLQAGIPVPAPLAWGWRGHPHQRQSFVILQAVPGEPAEVWATRLSADGPAESWHHKRRMVMALADLARRFHALGFRHRDFYLNHVFVSGSARTMELSLIDLQRVFRPRWRSQRWQVKDLAQLNFSATREAFSQTLRLRFFCHYLGVQSLKPEHKRLLHRILRKTRSMARRLRTRH